MKEVRAPAARRRKSWFRVAFLPVVAIAAYWGWVAWLGRETAAASRCHGSASSGSIDHARRLPYWGDNYRAYSLLGYLSGRTFMHSSVRNAVLASYASVAKQRPELRYLYAESGWPWGGGFRPHRTHANGTAVDFFVPVRTREGAVSELPVSVFNMLGYGVSFDASGTSGDSQIDFEAMALHLNALDRAAREQGITIKRIIFDGRLQPKLFATQAGQRLSGRFNFLGKAWFPHDQHYHVDFDVSCN